METPNLKGSSVYALADVALSRGGVTGRVNRHWGLRFGSAVIFRVE